MLPFLAQALAHDWRLEGGSAVPPMMQYVGISLVISQTQSLLHYATGCCTCLVLDGLIARILAIGMVVTVTVILTHPAASLHHHEAAPLSQATAMPEVFPMILLRKHRSLAHPSGPLLT